MENTKPVEAVKVEPAKAVMVRYGTSDPDTPQIGLGTNFVITPASGSPITPEKITALKMPTLAGKDVDITGFSDAFDAYMPGVLNAGELEVDGIYLKTQCAAIYALVNVKGTTFTATYNDGAVRSFVGFINSYNEGLTLREKTTVKFKVRATSLVVMS